MLCIMICCRCLVRTAVYLYSSNCILKTKLIQLIQTKTQNMTSARTQYIYIYATHHIQHTHPIEDIFTSKLSQLRKLKLKIWHQLSSKKLKTYYIHIQHTHPIYFVFNLWRKTSHSKNDHFFEICFRSRTTVSLIT